MLRSPNLFNSKQQHVTKIENNTGRADEPISIDMTCQDDQIKQNRKCIHLP